MKYILIITLFLSSLSGISQRYIKAKGSSTFLADSSGLIISGTINQIQNWFNANIDVDDTSNFNIVNSLPAIYALQIYQSENDFPDEIPFALTTAKINRLRRVKQGTIKFDKTLNVWKGWNGTVWKIITTN